MAQLESPPVFLKVWADLVPGVLQETTALAVGVFLSDGKLVYANQGMQTLLGAEAVHDVATSRFINPSFEELIRRSEQEGPVFLGILTTGDGHRQSQSTHARVYRRGEQLFIAAEYDVLGLGRMNLQMMEMNQEINNLQRALIKEKTILEKTLRELRKTQAMLIHAEKMTAMGQLVAGVAHEVNNPISFVISNLHSLKDSFVYLSNAYEKLEEYVVAKTGDEGRQISESVRDAHDMEFILEDLPELLDGSLEGAMRIKKIVQNLRTFSRLDEATIKKADIVDNIQSTLALADSELKKRGIQVRLDLETLDPIVCYPSDLNQVFMNLIVNAAQAMESGGSLTIRARQDSTTLTLEFEDTGPGIPEEIRKDIFNPFFTTKPVGSGTGLGLSLAYEIITEKHRGTIAVESAENGGACFRIRLPRDLKGE